MNCRLTTLRSTRWKTVLLSSVLLLQAIPLWAHGGSVVANSTDSNSSSLSTTAVKSLQRGHVPRGQDETGSGASAEGGGGNRLGITHDANPDSAEREHLIGPPLGAGLPTWPGRRPPSWARLDFQEEDQEEDSAPRWRSAILKPDGTVLHAEDLQVQSPPAAETSLPFSQADSSPALAVRLHSDSVVQQNFNNDQLPVPPRPQELQGGDPTSWTLSDFYDYLSPDYSTTEVLPDEDPPTTVDMADENMVPAAGSNSRSRVRDDGASGGSDSGGFPGSDGCALGYTRSNATCRSLCEVFSGYCFNGGQCYLVEGIGAFCRCNVQEYMWNKGSRCESVITDFQVMCIAVGGASVMLLLLFMVIVFFAKRLHLLKAENRRLRRRSKYRPQSEQLNDNFSLSTIAEGSQANKTMSRYTWEYKPKEETYAEQEDCAKLEEPVKSPPSKEDESLIIQNSVTPTHENDKVGGEDNADEAGVTIDLELLLPKEAKMHPQTSPPLHYNVFLYKLPPKSPKKSPVLRCPPGRSGQRGSLSQLCPRRSSEPGYSPVSTRSLPPMPVRVPNPRLGKACTP